MPAFCLPSCLSHPDTHMCRHQSQVGHAHAPPALPVTCRQDEATADGGPLAAVVAVLHLKLCFGALQCHSSSCKLVLLGQANQLARKIKGAHHCARAGALGSISRQGELQQGLCCRPVEPYAKSQRRGNPGTMLCRARVLSGSPPATDMFCWDMLSSTLHTPPLAWELPFRAQYAVLRHQVAYLGTSLQSTVCSALHTLYYRVCLPTPLHAGGRMCPTQLAWVSTRLADSGHCNTSHPHVTLSLSPTAYPRGGLAFCTSRQHSEHSQSHRCTCRPSPSPCPAPQAYPCGGLAFYNMNVDQAH